MKSIARYKWLPRHNSSFYLHTYVMDTEITEPILARFGCAETVPLR